MASAQRDTASQWSGLSVDVEKEARPAADGDGAQAEEAGASEAAKAEATGGDVEKAVTNRSKLSLKVNVPTANDVSTVPNGGRVAWLQVVGAFFVWFNTWGVVNTFGLFQTEYETGILKDWSASDIAWIGSMQSFLLMFVGPLCGPLYDAGYFHALLVAGTVLVSLGFFMLSLSTTYYQVFLAQAVCVGLGAGLMFIPSAAILSTYFTTHLALATGVAAVGSSIGGVIYPIMLNQLLKTTGFAWATRAVGFMVLATMLISNLVMRVRVLPAAKRSIFELGAWKEPPWVLLTLGLTVACWGLYPPFFYSGAYTIDYDISSSEIAFYTLTFINAGSLVGRLLPNALADIVGPFNVIAPASLISGILALCLIPAKTQSSLIALCVLYGCASGALVSLPATVVVSVSMHRRAMIGTRMGMTFCFGSFGVLIGTPVAGAILDRSGFTGVWIFSGMLLMAGGALIVAGRLTKTGPKLMIKA